MLVRKRSVFASIVLAMCMSGLALPAHAASATIKVSGSTQYSPIESRTVTISGKLSNKTKNRAVYLHRRAAGVGNFKSIAKSKTGKNGAYNFKVTVLGNAKISYDYRVWGAARKGKFGAQYVPNATPGKRVTFTNPWKVAFNDVFNSRANWGIRYPGQRSRKSLRACSQSNARMAYTRSGKLELSARPSGTTTSECTRVMKAAYKTTYGSKNYGKYIKKEKKYNKIMLTGHVSTASVGGNGYTVDLTKPGIAAARIQFAKPRGQHGGFWLRPVNAGVKHEIDVVEYMGYGGKERGLYQFLYTAAGKKIGRLGTNNILKSLGKKTKWYSGYRTYVVEWSGKGSDGKVTYTWRIDGRQTYKYRTAASSTRHELILSQLASDYELPRLPRSSKAGTMKVDWVTTWTK